MAERRWGRRQAPAAQGRVTPPGGPVVVPGGPGTTAGASPAGPAAASNGATEAGAPNRPREVIIRSPFRFGFFGAVGVLLALLLGQAVGQLSTIIIYIIAALFIALGLDPVVRFLERHRFPRGLAIATVFVAFALVVAGVLALVVPIVVEQLASLVQTLPHYLQDITHQQWFEDLSNSVPFLDLHNLLSTIQGFASDPQNWANVAGGVLKVTLVIGNGFVAVLVVFILTLYFLANLNRMKEAMYRLLPASSRPGAAEITDQVTASVGGYVGGMVILALINGVLGFIVMTIVGVPFAPVLALLIFLLALIPLIGSVLGTILVTAVALFNSPVAAIIILVYYLVYMQVESYVLTPRIMNRTIAVPGALVVIGALAGGTLLGLLGALIAIPVTAAILIIINKVVVPRQDRR